MRLGFLVSIFSSHSTLHVFIDGLNDSVALSAADVAVAMSHGAQVSIASADFVLLGSKLNALVDLLRISRKVYR